MVEEQTLLQHLLVLQLEMLEVEEVRMNVGLKTRGEDGAHHPLPTTVAWLTRCCAVF